MTFQEPLLLYGLPAALLPLIIHLLNRLRYRSVRWAAMPFLNAATRSSHRRSRLRHYLVLLCRMLALFFLVLALCRPVTGGWIGGLLQGAPETILVLLDRSASMEARDPALQMSKREYALDLFARAAQRQGSGSRLVLVENVLRSPQELAGASALRTLSAAGPTDTAADLPAMFRAALNYQVANRCGRTEIWVASDLQRSNWRPESSEWQDVMARLSALPGAPRARVLALCREYARNTSVGIRDVIRGGSRERPQLMLGLEIQESVSRPEPIPLTLTVDGARSQEELTIPSPSFRFHRRLELPAGKAGGGWGSVEIPADENLRDNAAWFVYRGEATLKAVVVGDKGDALRRVARAAAPDPSRLSSACEVVAPDAAAGTSWRDLALVVWMAPAPGPEVQEALAGFVEQGGVAVCFPPEKADTPGLFGLTWKAVETAKAESPFRAGPWEENDGPLARTENGQSLPVGKLSFLKRQAAAFAGDAGAKFFALASYADGRPFLLRRVLGRGQVFVFTSLPRAEWSSLGEGPVLVPALQRLLHLGGRRLTSSENAVCGEWKPENEAEVWAPVGAPGPRNPRWEAGVYQCGSRQVALNRPAIEDSLEPVEEAKVRALFGDVPVQIEKDLTGHARGRTEREIWPLLLGLVMLCLLAESWLVLGYGRPRPAALEPAVGKAT